MELVIIELPEESRNLRDHVVSEYEILELTSLLVLGRALLATD